MESMSTVRSAESLAPIFEPLSEAHVKIAAPRPDDRALDLASGTGVMARHLERAGVKFVVASDPNRVRLREGRPMSGFGFVAARAEALPYADGAFSLVACQHGVMFFSDVSVALRETFRVLEPAGRTTLTAWFEAERSTGLFCLNQALVQVVGEAAQRNSAVPFSMPDPDRVAAPLRAAGFEDVVCHPIEVDVCFRSAREFARSFIRATSLAPVVASAGSNAAVQIADIVERELGSESGAFRFVANAYCVAGVRP
jgi:ubiquinone/menaquinone biosynthesis C-methylase UbiE